MSSNLHQKRWQAKTGAMYRPRQGTRALHVCANGPRGFARLHLSVCDTAQWGEHLRMGGICKTPNGHIGHHDRSAAYTETMLGMAGNLQIETVLR